MPNPRPKFAAKHEKQWRKGQSGNPGGLRKGEVARKALKRFTQAALAEAFSKVMRLTPKEVMDGSSAKNMPMVEHVVACALLADAENGTLSNLEKIMERIVGKVYNKSISH